METTIQHMKLELIQWLSTLNDQSLIDELMKLRNQEKKDWWNELSEAEKVSIEKGIQDADNKNLTPHSSAKKLYEKWL